jgi:hypothetical protein
VYTALKVTNSKKAKKMEKDDTEIFDDLYLSERARSEVVQSERGPVLNLLFDAKDIVLGALNGAHEHPVWSIEIGAAGLVTGVAAALALSHHRTA